jgi:UDP:flavonoid glycosyltransferase YjiC (YdhE family)
MRVLFTSTSGWGHVHPMVPLALAFLDRGDDVLWATGDEACGRLEREGIRTSVAGLDDAAATARFFEEYPEVQSVPPPERSDFMFPRLFGIVRAPVMSVDLLPVAREWSPELVVSEAGEFAGPIAAAVLGVPGVTLGFGALLPEPRVAAAGQAVAPLWAAQGLEPRPYGGTYDNLYLDIYPSSMQPTDRPHLAATQPLRPGAFASGEDEMLPDWVTAPSSDPLVYVTFGTVFSNDEALATVVGAIGRLPVRVVVTVGPRGDPASLGSQPDNVHVARYIPQTQLLEHCAVVVSHSGSGTLLASLAAELPQLCIPQGADQFFNAGACAQAGAGIALAPGGITSEAVTDAVGLLLADPSYRDAATRISREIMEMPSPGAVAELLHGRFG